MPAKRAPMITPQVKEIPVDMTVKIDQTLLAQLDEHCKNIASEREYVVSQMIRVILDHDRANSPKTFSEKGPERLVSRAGTLKGKRDVWGRGWRVLPADFDRFMDGLV